MRIAKILAVLGVLMIMIGMTIQAEDYQEQIKEQQEEIIKLQKENEALWDNYYMNVTNKEGYEYYE